MKTITEYQPMVFSALFSEAARRRSRAGQILQRTAIGLLIGYAALALKITADTGLAAWNWQFWLIFAPLFLLGEKVLQVVAHFARFAPSYLERTLR
jgi:hypothetical protein